MAGSVKTFRTTSLCGGINSTSSADGLITFPTKTNPDAAMQMRDQENFYPLDRGGLKKVPGFSVFKATGVSSPVTGITRFQKSDGTNQFIYSQGTSVYKLGDPTPIATVASGATIRFCVGNDLLVICDGVNQMQWWDGATIHTNANASLPTAAIKAIFFQNRFWIMTATAPNQSNVYYSAPNDITQGYGDGTDLGGFVQCDYNDGDVVIDIVSSFLTNSLNPIIGVAKNRKFGIITEVQVAGVTTYAFSAIDTVIGAASSDSVCRVGQDIFYFNKLGLTAARTQVNYNQLYNEYLSVNVSNQFNTTKISTLNNAILFYDWASYRVCIAINEVGYQHPNVLWCYDVRLKCWYKERWGNPNNLTSVFIDTDGTFYHGDSNGNIYIHGPQYHDFNGNVISAYFVLPYLDFGDQSAWKQFTLMSCSLSGGSKTPVIITYDLNFGASKASSNSIRPSQSPYVWGGGVWTSDPSVYQWGSATTANRRFWPRAYFNNVSPRFSHSDNTNNLEIFSLSCDVLYTGHR